MAKLKDKKNRQKNIDLRYTTIIHQARKKLGLTSNEYIIADSIYHLSNNPSAPVAGWCSTSKKDLGTFAGISEQSTYPIIARLIKKSLVEKNIATKFLRTTQRWYDHVILLRNKLKDMISE